MLPFGRLSAYAYQIVTLLTIFSCAKMECDTLEQGREGASGCACKNGLFKIEEKCSLDHPERQVDPPSPTFTHLHEASSFTGRYNKLIEGRRV